MRVSTIKINSAFGVHETVLGPESAEITGKKGSGKTSVLDAIRFALTNRTDRDYVVKQGASEAEIVIETDTGLRVDRKRKADRNDSDLLLKDGGLNVQRPQTFLNDIITPLQLNPVDFIAKPVAEQNRIILNLIDYDWSMDTIQGWFGEVPPGVDYGQNILSVLDQIQSERGAYYQTRQKINSEALHKGKSVGDIAADLPDGYQAEKWRSYDLSNGYQELERKRADNAKIERARAFRDSKSDKLRAIQADRDIAIAAEEKAIASKRESLTATIERLRAEILAAEKEVSGLNDRLEDKKKVIRSQYQESVAKLEKGMGVADEFADKEPESVDALQSEISTAESMIRHLNEYDRMKAMQADVDRLQEESDELTRKIQLARTLPGQVLAEATLPIEGLSVKDGIPLVNGLPLSNLSDGEKLDLCVDVAISNPKGLQIILIDGTERLDDESRDALYRKCGEKGLQFIATRTTNDNELKVTQL